MQRGLKGSNATETKSLNIFVSMQRGLKAAVHVELLLDLLLCLNAKRIESAVFALWALPRSAVSMQRGLKGVRSYLIKALYWLVSMQRGLKVKLISSTYISLELSSQCKEDWKTSWTLGRWTVWCIESQCKEDWKGGGGRGQARRPRPSQCKEDWKFSQTVV